MDTTVCTERTSGVASPERIRETASNRTQERAEPVHPKLRKPYTFFATPLARSRMVAISGRNPIYQNRRDTEKYVEIENKSQTSGELKYTQREPYWFGSGNTQKNHQGMPMGVER